MRALKIESTSAANSSGQSPLETLENLIAEVCREKQWVLSERTPLDLRWRAACEFEISVAFQDESRTFKARGLLEWHCASPRNPQQIDNLVDVSEKSRLGQNALVKAELSSSLSLLFATYLPALSSEKGKLLAAGISLVLQSGANLSELTQLSSLRRLLPREVQSALSAVDLKRAKQVLALEDYPQAFPLARALHRKIHRRLGPTNSGKTYAALQALASARSGVYLAPLRLLALEIRDRLVEQGVPCNLLTGEEHEPMAGALHTASTIEMLNTESEVEVAVIDEAQMLLDEGRGWAWTAAMVGVPAHEVYLCGAPDIEDVTARLFAALGEQVDTMHLERKTPLVIKSLRPSGGSRKNKKTVEVLQLGDVVQKGDAVIAFSRDEVLKLSQTLKKEGLSVATLYGALAPEVRRAEAERFAEGEADAVVATDVIGMGLNLPISRVIFSRLNKFDGQVVRALTPTEARQIAGRAGRFGLFEEGVATTLVDRDISQLNELLAEQIPGYEGKLRLAPSLWHVRQLSEILATSQIAPLLLYFSQNIAIRSPLFETAKLEGMIAVAQRVDSGLGRLGVNLPVDARFSLACAPVSLDKDTQLNFFDAAIRLLAKNQEVSLTKLPDWLLKNSAGFLQEAEQQYQVLSLYAWLARKFPTIFTTSAKDIANQRKQLSDYVSFQLLRN